MNVLSNFQILDSFSFCSLFTLGSMSHKIVPITLYIMSTMHLQSLKLLPPTVKEMHLQEIHDMTKVTQNVVQYPPHHVTYAPV